MKLQLNQNYTARQRGLLSAFRATGEASVDEIAIAMELETERHISRSAVAHSVSTIANKLAQDGYVLLRKSKLGRSHKGLWELVELGSMPSTTGESDGRY